MTSGSDPLAGKEPENNNNYIIARPKAKIPATVRNQRPVSRTARAGSRLHQPTTPLG